MNQIKLPNYTDDEVGFFHPICEKALNQALEKLNLKNDYLVVHHYQIGNIIPDYIIQNKQNNKILLVVEVKRTPAQVNSTRYKDQARSYILESGPSRLESPYYVLTNLELTNFFKHDTQRTSVNKQILAPSPMFAGYFSNDFSLEKLVEYFVTCINTAKMDSGRFIWGYDEIVTILEQYDINMSNWHTAFTVIAYEFIRAVLNDREQLNISRWKKASYYRNNPRMLLDNIKKVNFTTLTSPDINQSNEVWEQSFLESIKEIANKAINGDELTSAIHEYLVKNKSQFGIVPTDLELAIALAALTIEDSSYSSSSIICDPAAGGGNLLAALIDYKPSVLPNQIKANDISENLSHLLSLRLGLRFPKLISPTNSPKVSNENILDLPRDYFDNVDFILLNPPYVSGVRDQNIKQTFFDKLKKDHQVDAITDLGQMPLEGPFLEYLVERMKSNTTIGVVFPKSHLFGLGKESQAIRKLLMEKFGLKKIFLYPRENLFKDVTKETVILVGQKDVTTDEITLISTVSKISDIDIKELANLIESDKLDIIQIPKSSFNDNLIKGWKGIFSDFDVKSEIYSIFNNLQNFPVSYRGKVGNSGLTDYLFISKHRYWNEIKDSVPSDWLVSGIENTKDIEEDDKDLKNVNVKFLAPPKDAFTPNTPENIVLHDIIAKIQGFPSLSSQKKVKKQKSLSEIIKIIKNDSNKTKLVPKGSLIIPRNLRRCFKAYISSEPMYVSTNFFVIEKSNNVNTEFIYSWLFSVFGQIQLEYYSKLQEGARKSEKAAFESVKLPVVDEFVKCDLTTREFYDFGTVSNLDKEWADLLGVDTDKLEEFNAAMYDLIMQRQP
ncbi:BpuSI family type II restriction endonuclease [Leptotrichia wadei]|jgi:site-specific endonuclease|uniref:BpuSI family type II restriction endonuclease n=1 Tax=Leptotrichia wadei TaxID=157687 RepID=UPI0028E77006|nr:BpuSI family type II restriction endonuclease [Leptotrichia wadei]